jgi:superoxide dismutase, Fe-Mn family
MLHLLPASAKKHLSEADMFEDPRTRLAGLLSRRQVLKLVGGTVAALAAASALPDSIFAAPGGAGAAVTAPSRATGTPMSFVLPPLPYPYDALEPYIDAATMQVHHDLIHGAYVTNLNAALTLHPEVQFATIEDLLSNLNKVPKDIVLAVRHNGGGHYNHSQFWLAMAPNSGGQPTGALASAINAAWGTFAGFQTQFSQAALGQFGDGWVWLVRGKKGLSIESTAGEDDPIMLGQAPVLGLDVWEHGYFLKYRNRRADYLSAWWNTVNWPAIESRYAAL